MKVTGNPAMLDAGVPFVWWPCISQQIALECDKRLLVNTYTIATGDTSNTISQANDMIWSVWIERESFFLSCGQFVSLSWYFQTWLNYISQHHHNFKCILSQHDIMELARSEIECSSEGICWSFQSTQIRTFMNLLIAWKSRQFLIILWFSMVIQADHL